jgi:hypothetical protein
MISTMDDMPYHIAGYVPHVLRQATVGGQTPTDFLNTRFSNFYDNYIFFDRRIRGFPIAFGQPLSAFTEKQFAAELDLYNVGTIAAQTTATRRALNHFTSLLAPSGWEGEFKTYTVRLPHSWFVKGGGTLDFDYDRLSIRDATPGVIILKFHWLPMLTVAPPVRLQPVYLGRDPVPFIFIDNRAGERRIDVVNGGFPH